MNRHCRLLNRHCRLLNRHCRLWNRHCRLWNRNLRHCRLRRRHCRLRGLSRLGFHWDVGRCRNDIGWRKVLGLWNGKDKRSERYLLRGVNFVR